MNGKIRTLGFYQPFCTLMLYGKIETRWVRKGRIPPFPKGKYLLYTTKKPAGDKIYDWCSVPTIMSIDETCKHENKSLNGYALCIGELVEIYPMKKEDEPLAFVNFVGQKTEFYGKEGKPIVKVQWCLRFENIERIEPFVFLYGKQGVGIFPEIEHYKIKILQPCQSVSV